MEISRYAWFFVICKIFIGKNHAGKCILTLIQGDLESYPHWALVGTIKMSKITVIAPCSTRRRGFTLLQVLVVIGIIGILAAILMSVFERAKIPTNRAACDIRLKQVVMAIDTFRQERGRMPENLNELVVNGYVTPDALRCPADTGYDAAKTKDPTYSSYGDGYVIREPLDSGDLPIILCPFHERDGEYGAQGYKGGYTKQFAAHPATLLAGGFSGAVTVTRPVEGILPLPSKGGAPLLLRGGDHIKTGAGTATINFEDGSTASIQANTEMSVLQSYTEGQSGGLLYTLVRQFTGRVNYYVNSGSSFDVATPTATAGAVGTRFTIDIVPASSLSSGTTTLVGNDLETVLTVTEHVVSLSTDERTIDVDDTDPPVAAHDPKNKDKPRKPKKAKKAKT